MENFAKAVTYFVLYFLQALEMGFFSLGRFFNPPSTPEKTPTFS
jgi:hypothetical protein